MEAIRVLVRDEVSGGLPLIETRITAQLLQVANVMVHTSHHIVIQGMMHPPNGVGTGLAISDELRNHGVIEHGDLKALKDTGINTDGGLVILMDNMNHTRRREER